MLHGIPALRMLLGACEVAHREGYIIGLDGRILKCATKHGALNDLLQSDGAIVMKHALLIFKAKLQAEKREHAFMLNVHDEWQLECRPNDTERIGRLGVEAIVEAGEKLGVRMKLDGEFKVGNTWKETH